MKIVRNMGELTSVYTKKISVLFRSFSIGWGKILFLPSIELLGVEESAAREILPLLPGEENQRCDQRRTVS